MRLQHCMIAASLSLATVLFGCAAPERSRNVADAQVSGQTLAVQVCSICHGVTGNSVSPLYPNLAGQQEDYLVAQLTDFRGHVRKDGVATQYMWGFTHLTESQVKELAKYFASQPPMRCDVNPSSGAREKGATIFAKGASDAKVTPCESCHGVAGQGVGTIPRIAGQHADYLAKQIDVFRNTDTRPRGAAMKMECHALTKPDVDAVTTYLETLGR